MKIRWPNIEVEYTKFIGGLDQKTPYLTFPPGALIAGKNYVPATEGGYTRIDGYERFDGRAAPSDANYVYIEVTITGTVSVGDTITGVTSTETAYVIVVSDDYIEVVAASGSFTDGESFTVGGVVQGTIIDSLTNGNPTAYGTAVAKNAAADYYRTLITKPTGTLPVRGIAMLAGTLYAFVDNAGGTAGKIYKSSSSGWTEVLLYTEISFDTGVGQIYDGDSITQLVSGATADVKRVVLESGAWGSDAAGRLILNNITGTFTATNDIQVSAVTKATAASLATAITIDPGGRYEIITHNFSGATDTRRLYGCDSVNKGFEFDGDVYVPINLPALDNVTDAPTHVYAHKLQLFFSIQAASFNSEPGKPYEYTAISGTIELALGDDITGYMGLPGEVLGLFSRNSSKQLLGNSADDFNLNNISDETGAIAHTVQKMNYAFVLDDRGIMRYVPTDVYGNFTSNTISQRIQKAIKAMRKVITASSVYRSEDQYRLYGSDGSGICMTRVSDQYHFGLFEYAHNVSCTWTGEDSTGKDVVFFGTDDGWVMQADKGSSFDGEDIEAFIILPFNNSQSPTTLKTYRRAVIEMVCDLYSPLKFSADLSYADPNLAAPIVNSINESGAGGFWDVADWEDFFYDTQFVNNPSFHLQGVGVNMGLTIYSKSDIDIGHKLDGVIVHYTTRRIQK